MLKEITISIPGDKSISHRAIIFGSLSKKTSVFHNFLTSEDCLHTIECFKDLGVPIKKAQNAIEIVGVGLNGLKAPQRDLYVGNSGTSIRLLTGILAGQSFDSVITGDKSIQKRPMKRIVDPLRKMGAVITGIEKDGNIYPPLKIKGSQKLKNISYKMPVASAQVDSCLRLASLYAAAEKLEIDNKGMQYRNHTENMLVWFDKYNNNLLDKNIFTIPSDISSAAFFIVAGCLLSNIKITIKGINVNKTRTGILDVLNQMGANISLSNKAENDFNEPVADIIVQSSALRSTKITKSMIPRLVDEIPIISLAAALAEGETVISGAEELRHKESDRLKTVTTELLKIGADITEKEDGLIIKGLSFLHGANCKSYGDHRIAMMLEIAQLLLPKGEKITIDDTDCINTSFPGFGKLILRAKNEISKSNAR